MIFDYDELDQSQVTSVDTCVVTLQQRYELCNDGAVHVSKLA